MQEAAESQDPQTAGRAEARPPGRHRRTSPQDCGRNRGLLPPQALQKADRRATLPETSIIWGGWSELPNKEREFGAIEIQQLLEQAPDPGNRVLLSDERDRLGCRKAKVTGAERDRLGEHQAYQPDPPTGVRPEWDWPLRDRQGLRDAGIQLDVAWCLPSHGDDADA